MSKSHITKIFVSLACVLTCCFFLVGCNGQNAIPTANDMEKAATSAYFAEVNSVVGEFNGALADFPADVKDKNVTDMKDKLEASQKILDKFNAIEAPQNCTDIHKNYGDGLLQMQQALSDYVAVYSSFVNGELGNDVLNQRVASIQNSYNNGLDLLNKADKQAAEATK